MGISPFRNVYMGYCVICCVHTYICTGSVGTLVHMYAEICLYSRISVVCAFLLARFPGRDLVLAHTQSPVGRSLPAARCFGLICPWVRKVAAVYLGQGGRLVVKVQLMPVITLSLSQGRYIRCDTGVFAISGFSKGVVFAKMQDGGTKNSPGMRMGHVGGVWGIVLNAASMLPISRTFCYNTWQERAILNMEPPCYATDRASEGVMLR